MGATLGAPPAPTTGAVTDLSTLNLQRLVHGAWVPWPWFMERFLCVTCPGEFFSVPAACLLSTSRASGLSCDLTSVTGLSEVVDLQFVQFCPRCVDRNDHFRADHTLGQTLEVA